MLRITRQFLGSHWRSHKKRTQHSEKWWRQTRAGYLTDRTLEENWDRPSFPGFSENVDRPYVAPAECPCTQCNKHIDVATVGHNMYVWVPSGNATLPTPMGYFFHIDCFKCKQCGFRFHHNKFYSTDDGRGAICMNCAMGKQLTYPRVRWHTSMVSPNRLGSRPTGHQFPRWAHQTEFLYDPNA
jgi:hypothetical protein